MEMLGNFDFKKCEYFASPNSLRNANHWMQCGQIVRIYPTKVAYLTFLLKWSDFKVVELGSLILVGFGG